MDTLIKGIRERFIADAPLFSSLTGGMHLGDEPAEKTHPYCVVLVEETPWWTFDNDFESYIILFYMYSRVRSPATILDIYSKLKAAFDEAALVIDGYHVIRFWRTG